MNWSKTKTILIIALLITNAVMLGYLYSQKKGQENAAVLDRMVYQDVLKVLTDRKIQVAFPGIPETDGVQAVEAAYETYDLPLVAKRFMGESFEVNGEGTEASLKGQRVRVLNDIKLFYEDTSIPPSSKVLAEEAALEIARKFIIAHGYPLDENTLLSSVKVKGKDIEVVFGQQTSHRLIENGMMRLMVGEGGVHSFERTWLKVLAVREMTYEIIPAGRALMKLSEQLSNDLSPDQTAVITGMTVSYKLDTDAVNSNILSGDLSPYWRFTTRSGITYSIKALQ